MSQPGSMGKTVAKRVLEEVDSSFPGEVEFLSQLIRIPTPNPPGRYEEIASYLQSYSQNLGFDVDVIETPYEICARNGIAASDRRLSVLMRTGRKGAGPRILLLGHLDTVPAGDRSAWKRDPFGAEVAEGKVFGRGACDCKGRIAAYLFAASALSRTLGTLPCELIVAATADEETGGTTGTKYLLESGMLNCDYCIGEGYTWEVFNGFKGLLWLRISIKGKSAHGATPHLGMSAAKPLQAVLRLLDDYGAKLSSLDAASGTTMNIGIINAGTKINMVPDTATVDIDLRVSASYGVERVIGDFRKMLEQLKKSEAGLGFDLEVLNRSDPIELEPSHPLVKVVRDSAEQVTGRSIPVSIWFAHSDTIHLLRKGIPSVNYGVGKPNAPHTPDEHVELEDLKISTKAIAMSVMRLAGGVTDGN